MRSASVAVLAAFVAVLGAACSSKRVAPAPPETARTVVVLLPDSETGSHRPRIPVEHAPVRPT